MEIRTGGWRRRDADGEAGDGREERSRLCGPGVEAEDALGRARRYRLSGRSREGEPGKRRRGPYTGAKFLVRVQTRRRRPGVRWMDVPIVVPFRFLSGLSRSRRVCLSRSRTEPARNCRVSLMVAPLVRLCRHSTERRNRQRYQARWLALLRVSGSASAGGSPRTRWSMYGMRRCEHNDPRRNPTQGARPAIVST